MVAQSKESQSAHESLGVIEAQGLLPVISAADAMTKAADVELLNYERVGGGKIALWIGGTLSAVRVAVEASREAPGAGGLILGTAVFARPDPATASLVEGLGKGPKIEARPRNGGSSALGVLETRGYVALATGIEAMVKSADISLIGYERVGGGILTALIAGEIAAVETATAAGSEAAGRAGEVLGVNIIARPDAEMVDVLPIHPSLVRGGGEPAKAAALKGATS